MRNNHTTLFIIQMIVVAFVCIVVFSLIFSYFIQRKKMIKVGSLDEEILKDYKEKQTKKYKVKRVIGNIFSITLTVFFVGLMSIGVFTKASKNMFPLGQQQVLLVESGSMSQRNKINTYLNDYNLSNQIDVYDLIVVEKLPNEDEINLFDIVVYKSENRYLVHRVISIEERNESHPDCRYFRLRGDSNSVSDVYPVKYSDMVAIYTGKRIPVIGFFVAFLQSGLGYLSLGIALLYLIVTPIEERKMDKEIKRRLELLLNKDNELIEFNRVLFLNNRTVMSVKGKDLDIISNNEYVDTNSGPALFNETEIEHYQRILDERLLNINEFLPAVDIQGVEAETAELENVGEEVDDKGFKYKYIFSFTARLIRSSMLTQDFYNIIKNEALSYKGVSSKISWKHELFRHGRKKVIEMNVKGKTLCVYFPLDPDKYAVSRYHHIDLTKPGEEVDFPMMMKVKSERAAKYACELIEEVMGELNVGKEPEYSYANYRFKVISIEKMLNSNPPLARLVGSHSKRVSIAKSIIDENVSNFIDGSYNIVDDGIISKLSLNIVSKPFIEKLLSSNDEVKSSYNAIKNEALCYGLKSRISYSGETFRLHRKSYVKITISGKSLKVFYALDPNDYKDSPIPVMDYSDKESKKEIPCALWVKSNLATKRAQQLVDEACAKDGLVKGTYEDIDWCKLLLSSGNEIVPEIENVEEISLEEPAINKHSLDIVRRPFTEKLLKSSKEVKNSYNEIKDEAISYGLKPRMSVGGETFRLHKKSYAKITIPGKSLKVFYALNPSDYKESPIPVIDYSDKESKKDTPSALWVKSNLAIKRAKELLKNACEQDGLVKKEFEPKDWVKELRKLNSGSKECINTPKKETSKNIKKVAAPKNLEEKAIVIEVPVENNEVIKDKFSLNITKKSFVEKLSLANDELKSYYNDLKNEALSYGLKPRMSFSGETYRLHKKTYIKISIGGKSLKIYFALNAKEYSDSTIPLVDYSNKSSKSETPSALWVKSPLALKRAKVLIKEVCAKDIIKKIKK